MGCAVPRIDRGVPRQFSLSLSLSLVTKYRWGSEVVSLTSLAVIQRDALGGPGGDGGGPGGGGGAGAHLHAGKLSDWMHATSWPL